jgi:drug/metabolite transporter (DMT)-like permease
MRAATPPHPTAVLTPPPASPERAPRSRVLAVYSLLILIWGTTWLAIKVGLEHYPPFFSLAVRFGLAGPLILLIMKARGEKIPWEPRHQPFFATLGFLSFVVSFGVVYWAEQYVSSGLAAVIFSLLPLFTGVIAHRVLSHERLHPARILGLVIGLGGIVVINSADLAQMHPRAPLAAALLTLGPLVTATSTVLSKRRVQEFPPMAFAGLPMVYGGAVHTVMWLVLERDRALAWSWPGVASIAYLTLFGSLVTFSGYFWLLKRLQVSQVNLMAYLTPLVALTAGVVFLEETVTLRILAGAALVFVGVAVANRVRH